MERGFERRSISGVCRKKILISGPDGSVRMCDDMRGDLRGEHKVGRVAFFDSGGKLESEKERERRAAEGAGSVE